MWKKLMDMERSTNDFIRRVNVRGNTSTPYLGSRISLENTITTGSLIARYRYILSKHVSISLQALVVANLACVQAG